MKDMPKKEAKIDEAFEFDAPRFLDLTVEPPGTYYPADHDDPWFHEVMQIRDLLVVLRSSWRAR